MSEIQPNQPRRRGWLVYFLAAIALLAGLWWWLEHRTPAPVAAPDAKTPPSLQPLAHLKLPDKARIGQLGFYPDDTKLVAETTTGKLLVWDLPAGTLSYEQKEDFAAGNDEILADFRAKETYLSGVLGWAPAGPLAILPAIALPAETRRLLAWGTKNPAFTLDRRESHFRVVPGETATLIMRWNAMHYVRVAPGSNGPNQASRYRCGFLSLDTAPQFDIPHLWVSDDRMTSCGFSNDGNYLLVRSGKDALTYVDVNRSTMVMEPAVLHELPAVIQNAWQLGNGGKLLVLDHNQVAGVWDADSGKRLFLLGSGKEPGDILAVSDNGKRVLIAHGKLQVCVWDTVTGSKVSTLEGAPSVVTTAALSSNGTRVLLEGFDRTLGLWDTTTGKKILPLVRAESGAAHALAMSADGNHLAVADEQAIQVWQLKT
jgi:WD40 repeat protein